MTMSPPPEPVPMNGAAKPAPGGRPESPWRDLARELFDDQGLGTVFNHARNVITGTVIIAAGLFAAHHPLQAQTLAMWTVHFAGHAVTVVGVLLLLLNLCDGLRRLARRQHPMVLRVAMVLAYCGLSVRLVQVFMLFRLAL